MLIGGIIIMPFLKFLIQGEIDPRLASIGFLLYLFNSVISYMFSNRICILNVAQEVYKVTIGTTTSKLLILLLQFIMLKKNPNFIAFMTIQLLVNIVYYIAINIYIVIKFPWINKGKENLKKSETKPLLKNMKAMFMYKISSLVVYCTDNLIISTFLGLSVLANYTNYQMVISAFQSLIVTGLGGITASIGNLLTNEKDNEQAYEVHKKIFFIISWMSSFILISLYNTLNQFIGIWIGKVYLLDNVTLIIILINSYVLLMKESVEQFQNGKGLFYQLRYAPLCEAILNFILSVILVRRIGLLGIFIGTLVSHMVVTFWTKPYIVYKYVFKMNIVIYFKLYIKYLLLALIPLVVTNYMTIPVKENYTILSFIANCFINIVAINLIYLVIFYRTSEFKYYYGLIKKVRINN